MAAPPVTALSGLARRPRLLVAAATAGLVAILAPEMWTSTRFILAWDCGIILFLGLVAAMIGRSDHERMQRRADREDAGAAAVLILAVIGSVASLAAIGAELRGMREAGSSTEFRRLALVGATVISSWLFVHVVFALHYAHDFYAGEEDRRGLSFPKTAKPDYWDFMYFSFNLGAAAQTSDVVIESSYLRRFVLAHTIISFLFNTTILALAINVGAGLL